MVQYAVFTVSGINRQKDLDELNTFLRSHRIYQVEKQFLAGAQGACWSFCIEYDAQVPVKGKNTIDHREVLSEKEIIWCQTPHLPQMLKHVGVDKSISDMVDNSVRQ